MEILKIITKYCKNCNQELQLKNNRDIERKKFCSRLCSNTYNMHKRISNLPKLSCKVCGNIFTPTNLSNKYCSDLCNSKKQVERSYKYLNNNPKAYISHLLCRKGREGISLEYIMELYHLQDGKCNLSNIELTFIKKTNSPKVHTNLSIDRIDSSKGYEIGNIQLVCAIVNIIKSTLSNEELLWWCSQVVEGGYPHTKF